MATYYDSTGNKVILTDELGKGGEGSVYSVAGVANLVGKIYHKPISAEKAEKLRWMASHKNQQLLKVAAWVTEILQDRLNGKIVGFLMPSVRAEEIHELYSPKSRRVHFPKADWRFLIHSAANLARAFNNVHQEGHVIGDVNHGNCAVLPDGTVKLIDCDSYSIHANGKVYPCEVGVTTHIAPELQKKTLRGAVRTQQQDNFGLAVIIFQILFLGRHPFAGKPLTRAEKSLEDCIQEHRFAYGAGAAKREVQPPPGTLALESVSRPVADLFERAFLTKDRRPTPKEWIQALEDLSKNLTKCRQNSGHYYLKSLQGCPWCELEMKTGLPLFPIDYQQQAQTTGGFNVLTIEQLLNSIQLPSPLPEKPQVTAITPAPDPSLVKKSKINGFFTTVLILFQVAILIASIVYMSSIGAFVIGIALAAIFYHISKSHDPQVKKEIINKLSEANKNWEQLEKDWGQREKGDSILGDKEEVKKKIAEYKKLPELRLQKLQELEKHIYERQLEDYLDRFYIDGANISGIGPARAATLQSYGIETAADVEKYKIQRIPGFGPTYTQNLLIWREGIKARFVFNPNKGVSNFDKQKVETQIASMRQQLETAMQNQVSQIRAKAANINGKNQYLTQRAVELAQTLAQAQSNRKAVSDFSLGVAAMFLAAFTVPIGGAAVRFALAPPAPPNTATVATNTAAMPTTPVPSPTEIANLNTNANISEAANANTLTNVNGNVNTNANANVSNFSELANVDINLLSDWEKGAKAEEMFQKGVEFTKANNYSNAAKYYREAIKFKGSEAKYYHELGYALYRLKRHQESVESLKKAVSLGSSGKNTQEILGLNYLEMKKWEEAKQIFMETARTDYSSFSTHYNLGFAAKNSGDYSAAVRGYERAVQIKPDNAQAQFELGMCYIKLDRISEAETQHRILLQLNPKLASQLYQAAINR